MTNQTQWANICETSEILPNIGVCALFKNQQVAIFKVIDQEGAEQLFAINNYCPFSRSNTISRGIAGNINNKIVIASPLYKQHFDLETGICIEDQNVKISTYPVRLKGSTVQLAA
ncbi:MAG: nitrite reductase small subunit NirD [Litorilituus sp.]|jgi:nitrite reductase (NADH) small subunit|nr:nitrite reductase small subunit NirD [Litorilituus sp.]